MVVGVTFPEESESKNKRSLSSSHVGGSLRILWVGGGGGSRVEDSLEIPAELSRVFSSNVKTHHRRAADCKRHALHRHTPRRRTRHWRRRPGKTMCVERARRTVARMRASSFQKTFEFSGRGCCVIVVVCCCLLWCWYVVVL